MTASKKHTSKQKPLVALYWDSQNVPLDTTSAKSLLDFAKSKGSLKSAKMYYNSQCKSEAFLEASVKELESLGIYGVDVPCPVKDSADNQIIADCLEAINDKSSPELVILVSGDGDFVKLVNTLQKLGKKVIIFARRGNVKQKLKNLADKFYFVDELPKLIGEKTQTPVNSVGCQIGYNEAIKYLIEAIKIALTKSKRAVLSYIDRTMRQLFSNYKGVSSICKHEGKAFSKFSKFVEAAVKDGKVRMQDQELFLIEQYKLAD